MMHDLKNYRDEPLFWLLVEYLFHLSVTCNWRFMNLNKAFQNVVGSTLRSLFVYSDVAESAVVANQVTDLLREVNYRRTGNGSHYFEPLHIQYIPLCKDLLDPLRRKCRRPQGSYLNLVRETRLSPFTSNEHERWKFNTIQT